MADVTEQWSPDPDRCFSPVPAVRELARTFYEAVAELPLVCPHGHVDPLLLADEERRFGDPAELLITPDHYVFRMLYSQGVPLEALGISGTPADPREVWQLFASHWHLFRGTPTGLWLSAVFSDLFGVRQRLNSATAEAIYEVIAEQLSSAEFTPRALFRRFGIEVLATTDAATDSLEPHQKLQREGYRVIPTFRPDRLFTFSAPGWQSELQQLCELTGTDVNNLDSFTAAVARRREQFIAAGAVATDHSRLTADLSPLPRAEAATLFDRALRGSLDDSASERLHGHMLYLMAGMSCEDGLVMQLHLGSLRNHNGPLFQRFGADRGADIPIRTDWTTGLRQLLGAFGNDPRLRVILFTLDESTYGRELAPLAGHWPALRLGPPWWFFDSVKGMERYLDQVVETAGFYNLAGFNDDTRAFPSIPARHDVWRRVSCNWLAEQTARGLLAEDEAAETAAWLAAGAARAAYRLD